MRVVEGAPDMHDRKLFQLSQRAVVFRSLVDPISWVQFNSLTERRLQCIIIITKWWQPKKK